MDNPAIAFYPHVSKRAASTDVVNSMLKTFSKLFFKRWKILASSFVYVNRRALTMIKFTITITKFSLKELKEMYRSYFGYDKKHKVTKADIAGWLGSMAESDVESFEPDEDE